MQHPVCMDESTSYAESDEVSFFALHTAPPRPEFSLRNESKEMPPDIFRDMDVFAQHVVDRILKNRLIFLKLSVSPPRDF